MKKILIAIIAISLVLSMAACAKSDEVSSVQTLSTSTEATVSADEVSDEPEISEEPVVEEVKNVPVLRDSVNADTGLFVGCAVTEAELDDEKVFDIVTTHFNRVTFGNELKPDALFNYSCTYCPGTYTDTLNDEEIVVPVLDYSRAERMLDKLYDWNTANPDKALKVRGHVLVWHSQTPEWFFHEDYDKSKPYVDKEIMNKRLEWYIKTVLTHFTGEDSKYKDMFYGWDVVNEAVSDGQGGVDGLRTDKENPSESLNEDRHGSNSSWYHIYESNEFIINAFTYANKYAPESLELYYNDYNECTFAKRNNIMTLLTAIKEKEGPKGEGTRITAMGMQGHYSMDDPTQDTVLASIKNYAKIVGNVQITELDISASADYDGSEESVIAENENLRKRYNLLYFSMKASMKVEGVNFQGFTFWGTVDHYSWLQSRSNVGGGNKTGLPQMPLLFDENYEPKPCFYVFANEN